MDDLFAQAEALQKDYSNSLPPVEQWDPPLSGDIDICIQRDGRWFHEGDEIRRHELVKLFSSILKREDDEYFLVTPVEKWRIKVEDVPFVVVDFDRRGRGEDQVLAFKTSTDDVVVAGPEHPIWVEFKTLPDGSGEPAPYILVRRNLAGLLSRNVFYHLVDLALENDGNEAITITSQGQEFPLSQQ